jgi:hypothetical protein
MRKPAANRWRDMQELSNRAFRRDRGPLRNQRHENFALARAKGRPVRSAFRVAGYPETASINNAYTIDQRPDVIRRIQELRKEFTSEESSTEGRGSRLD